MNCHIYIRVSTKKQSKDGFSLETQEKVCKEYIEDKKYTLCGVYKDVESGGSNNRAGYNKLKCCVRDNEAIVVYSISRLSRNLDGTREFIKFIKDRNIKLICIKEGDVIDVNTNMGNFAINLFLSIYEFEKEEIVERSKLVIEDKRKNGQLIGRLPYGWGRYTHGKRTFIYPIWHECQGINFIIKERSKAPPTGWHVLCEKMRLEGYYPNKDPTKNWCKSSLKHIYNRALKTRSNKNSLYFTYEEIVPYEKYKASTQLPIDVVLNNIDSETGLLDYDKVYGLNYYNRDKPIGQNQLIYDIDNNIAKLNKKELEKYQEIKENEEKEQENNIKKELLNKLDINDILKLLSLKK